MVDGRVVTARFRHVQRAAEGPAYAAWFRRNGYAVHEPGLVNEGEGDYLVTGTYVLAGSGFRTDPAVHGLVQEVLRRPVVGLRLVDPRYYHLDTALAVLDDDLIMYYPEAFSPGSRDVLNQLFPDALHATDADAAAFGLNAASDGHHVVLPHTAAGLIEQLDARGFRSIGVDMSEFLKAGGSVKCCTLELRD